MKGIEPCPYCGGEVEVVKLCRKKTEKEDVYRITCMHCKRTVARGIKFEDETPAKGMKRIEEYNKVIEERYALPGSNIIRQHYSARQRDKMARSYHAESSEFDIEL